MPMHAAGWSCSPSRCLLPVVGSLRPRVPLVAMHVKLLYSSARSWGFDHVPRLWLDVSPAVPREPALSATKIESCSTSHATFTRSGIPAGFWKRMRAARQKKTSCQTQAVPHGAYLNNDLQCILSVWSCRYNKLCFTHISLMQTHWRVGGWSFILKTAAHRQHRSDDKIRTRSE